MDSNRSDFTYSGYVGYNGNGGYSSRPPKKDKKTLGAPAIISICVIISLIAGLAGGFAGSILGNRIVGTPISGGGESAVIYRDVTLRNENGSKLDSKLTVGEIADNCRDSVVEITTEAVATGSFMMQYVTEGAGSGVFITQDGYIATNNHVVDGATSVSVRTTDGTVYTARVVGTDEKTDLAVIKIEGTGFKPAVFGNFENCKLGDTVVAIGNPLGQLGGTVTDGIISALDREITIDNNIMTLIQTNTAINPGNSGGGLFNTSGELIGIVNAKSSGENVEGLGFAIPINIASPIISNLIEFGYVTGRIDTGIEVLEIADFQSALYYRVAVAGLYVYSVSNGSPAAAAGIRAGDLIKSVNGEAISTAESYNKILETHNIGDTLEITLSRNNIEYTVPLTLTEYKPKAQ